MGFNVKDWENYPTETTPINGTALADMETRLSTYTDDSVAGLTSSSDSGIVWYTYGSTGTPTGLYDPSPGDFCLRSDGEVFEFDPEGAWIDIDINLKGATGPAGGFDQALIPNVQTENYTIQSSDLGKCLVGNSSGNITFTVPTGLGAGFQCQLLQLGGGQVTIAAAEGVTLGSDGGFVNTAAQYASAGLYEPIADTAILSGDLA